MSRSLRHLAVLCLLSIASGSGAQAMDVPAVKTSPGKPMKEKDPRGAAGSGSAPAPAASAPVVSNVDPMERLRLRLADRLGPRVGSLPDSDTVQVAVTAPETPPEVRRRGAAASSPRKPATAPSGAWAYEGAAGPEQWSRLRPEYALCGSGRRQSPIDIRDGIAVDLDPIEFDYTSNRFGVLDTGRTVQVNVGPGSAIEVMGRKYQLERIEFRRPAEERIQGRQFDMGAHLIHKDAEGRTAIVAVLLDRGAEQPVVQRVWNNLPLEKGDELTARTGIDPSGLLPTDRRYYTYMGSMTTPPCREGVLWMVMKSPVAISSEQLAVFSRLYPMNARPPQAASGRLIKGPQ